MVLCSNALVACPLRLSEYQKTERCAEDGIAIDIEKNDAGVVIKTLLS